MDKYVLIASTGNQDIKFFLKGGEKNTSPVAAATIFKARGDKGFLSIREVHQKLLDREIDYTFLSIEDSLIKDADIKFDNRLKPIISCKQDTFEAMKTRGKYLLFAAKLDTMIQTLKHMNDIDVVGGLFYGTDRPGMKNEPIASHRLMAEYFASQFENLNNTTKELSENGTDNLNCSVYWVNMTKTLDETNGWYYEGEGDDYPVKRVVARCIDESMKKFLDIFDDDTNALLSHTGGMPDLKSIIMASAKFRVQGMLLESHETAKSEKFDKTTFNNLIKQRHTISRRESLEIRNIVEDRIWQGDFNGAWSACANLYAKQGQSHDVWTCAIKIVKNYMAGVDVQDEQCSIASLSHDQELKEHFNSLKTLITELTQTVDIKAQIKATLTLSLFKVEAALQCKKQEELDVKNALLGCATLSDQLLRACAFLFLEKERESYSLKSNLDFSKDLVLPKTKIKGRLSEKLTFTGEERDVWRTIFEDYAGSLDICNLYQGRMGVENKKNKALQFYRNHLAHGKNIDKDLLLMILTNACAPISNFNELWNPILANQATLPLPIGECFLNQPYVLEIENSLNFGENYTQQKYKSLIEILLKIVRSTIYIPSE